MCEYVYLKYICITIIWHNTLLPSEHVQVPLLWSSKETPSNPDHGVERHHRSL